MRCTGDLLWGLDFQHTAKGTDLPQPHKKAKLKYNIKIKNIQSNFRERTGYVNK